MNVDIAMVLRFIGRTISWASPYGIYHGFRDGRPWNVRQITNYVAIWILAEILSVCVISSSYHWEWYSKAAVVLIAVRLGDMVLGFLRPLYAEPYKLIKRTHRLGFLAINVIEVAIIMGCLVFFWGNAWDPPIDTYTRGMYQAVTYLGTVGTADFAPREGASGDIARALIILEMSFSAMFLIFGVATITAEGGSQGGTDEATQSEDS